MNLFRIIFELFALYLLYKLIFDFIIPVARTTRQVKKQFNDMSSGMQETMQKQQAQQQNNTFTKTTAPAATSGKGDDYIEFEEIK